MPQILLVDNGSIKPAATVRLRQLAKQLGERCNCTVDAVSIRHADKIDTDQLGGMPAMVLPDYLQSHLKSGHRDFIILPLFFGLSRTITSFIPQIRTKLEVEFGGFNLTLAEVLHPLPAGDSRLANILYDNILQTVPAIQIKSANIVLVDHGSPLPEVNAVRQKVALDLEHLFGFGVKLSQASMERREGNEYDFNGELLEHWLLQKSRSGEKIAIVSMMFLLPGRHAGPGGDIEAICTSIMQQYSGFNIFITPLVAEHPQLVSLLHSRLKAVL